ncbi:50S ribosomal protein L11 [Candidatus Woesearchaeota archaeon]|nr:50S ribosomal protein L11 [Candidatus Woesearchaeota archaeon]
MAKQTIDALVSGGKATAAPPLGPALGPLGVNIGQVVSEINRKTASFNGMQVPVKVIVDSSTKEFEITIGTPPASALIKKEAGIEKGASNPLMDKVADILIEQAIKIAKMKEDSLLGKDLKQKVKEIVGTCQSMGILVEGKPANETIVDINNGKFDEQIKSGKTELTEEERKKLEIERQRLKEEMEARRHEFEAKAKAIIEEMKGAEKNAIKKRLIQEKIPGPLIRELLPEDAKPEEGKPAPAAPQKK